MTNKYLTLQILCMALKNEKVPPALYAIVWFSKIFFFCVKFLYFIQSVPCLYRVKKLLLNKARIFQDGNKYII